MQKIFNHKGTKSTKFGKSKEGNQSVIFFGQTFVLFVPS